MLAKLRSSSSHPKLSSVSHGNSVTETSVANDKDSQSKSSPERIAKLKKRKSIIPVFKEAEKQPVLEEEILEPSLKKLAAPPTKEIVRTVNDTTATPFGAYETEFRLLSDKRTKPTTVPDPTIITPDRNTLPLFDLRRENPVPPNIPLADNQMK